MNGYGFIHNQDGDVLMDWITHYDDGDDCDDDVEKSD